MPLDGNEADFAPVKVREPVTPVGIALWEAAKVLEDRGWCRGTYMSQGGSVCSLGAIAVACGKQPNLTFRMPVPILHALRAADELAPIGILHVWNDLTARSVTDVTDLFRKAAAKAEGWQ